MIDAIAMLASLEQQAAAIEERPDPALHVLLTIVPAAELGATMAMGSVALRAGEDVLRTARGGVVLRRRRATPNAA